MEKFSENEMFDAYITDRIFVFYLKSEVFRLFTDLDTSDHLIELIDQAEHDSAVKAMFFINEDGVYSEQNYDNFINRVMANGNDDNDEVPNFCERNLRFREINILNKFIRYIATFHKLVFAGIKGEIVTPFFGAYLASDFIFFQEEASVNFAHNKFGLHPSGALPFFLVQKLGHSRAMEIQMSKSMSSEEALNLGLINHIFPAEDFWDHSIQEIKKFTRNKMCTIRDTKRLTAFARKQLQDYMQFEASLLNL